MRPARRLAAGLALAICASLAAPALADPASLATTPISRLDTPWWRARHAEKLAEIHRGPVDLVFLGDSITQDYEKSGPPDWQNFKPVWDRFYGARHAVNLGFGGDATSHLLWRIEHGEIDGISPKAAVILIGANNLGRLHWPAAEDAAGIVKVVAETRQRLPRTKILLLSVLPSVRSEWATRTTSEINAQLARIYGGGRIADVVFVDLTNIFVRNGEVDRAMFLDPLLTPPEPPLHPTAQAQAVMAGAIEPILAGMLASPAKP